MKQPLQLPDLLERNIDAAISQFQCLRTLQEPLDEAVAVICECLRQGGKLLICGNGGSAADAGHLATEFVVRYNMDRPALAAVSLCDSGTLITAMGNDYDYRDVFSRQIRALGRVGDVLLVISTSGRSSSVVAALETAREMDIASISLLGRDGGRCRGLAAVEIVVPGNDTARIQEAHKLLYHTMCEMVEQIMLADLQE